MEMTMVPEGIAADEDPAQLPAASEADASPSAVTMVSDGALPEVEADEDPTAEGASSGSQGELVVDEDPAQSPAASEAKEPNAEPELSTDEKIQIVLAAFDTNQDGHLNYEESNELQKFASGDALDPMVYKVICRELRCSLHRGLGSRELRQCYERFGTLDRDFEAAQRKIRSRGGVSGVKGVNRGGCAGAKNWPMLLALPLLPVSPLAAAGLALVMSLHKPPRSSCKA
ncbi:unnamed protein product [Symbiodinium natans]|uniref:EF-hand domain-containing protein n=1 Tax=Symbiodinium natans TaxID=878477 RepID=A0A812TPL8_9DINO|nr:unnamed protein product [Symbiodinium natans]